MAFQPYRAGELTGIEHSFSSRQGDSLVCVLQGVDGGVSIHYSLDKPGKSYSRLTVHVTPGVMGGHEHNPPLITTEGSVAKFDGKVFTVQGDSIDAAVLNEFDQTGLPSDVQELYRLAANQGV